jgi:hypothetical protein
MVRETDCCKWATAPPAAPTIRKLKAADNHNFPANREREEVAEWNAMTQRLQSAINSAPHTLMVLELCNFTSVRALPVQVYEMVKDLNSLHTIIVSSNAALRYLRPSLFQCVSTLTVIDLSFNFLSDLPKELCGLSHLQVLRVNNNQLSFLPPDVDRWTTLIELDLRNNYFTSFPSGLTYLRKLKHFALHNNPLIGEDDLISSSVAEHIEECSLCHQAFRPEVDTCVPLINFVDIAGNQSVPILYKVCGERCARIVEEIMESEPSNFHELQYESHLDADE